MEHRGAGRGRRRLRRIIYLRMLVHETSRVVDLVVYDNVKIFLSAVTRYLGVGKLLIVGHGE